jgi:cytidyltransferase-like protein
MRIVHVEGDPKLKNGKGYAMFIGRFQPFHEGHKWVVDQIINQGKNVLICVRDIEPDDKNPFTTEQTISMIEKYHSSKGDDVKVMIIPDIESVNFGRGVGYEVNEFTPPTDIAHISATTIRNCIEKQDDFWKELVDESIQDDIISCLKKND